MGNKEKKTGGNIKYFCGKCGSQFYAHDERWSKYVYPFASAIDIPLPELDPTSDVYYIVLVSKANWVNAPKPGEKGFYAIKEYPYCSPEQWHKEHKKFIE